MIPRIRLTVAVDLHAGKSNLVSRKLAYLPFPQAEKEKGDTAATGT